MVISKIFIKYFLKYWFLSKLFGKMLIIKIDLLFLLAILSINQTHYQSLKYSYYWNVK